MASAARDPYFRANQIGVNEVVRSLGLDGAGNMCMRCHSPNGWYSGRFDPTLAGDPRGTTMEHSILQSTDDEGILCEFCHRAIGNVTMQRPDLSATDPAWNMLAGVSDWPHAGHAYVDQAGDTTIAAGSPYGDTSLQLNDGMTYLGKYPGSVDIFFSDLPEAGTSYTGQTYGVYPPGFPNAGAPVVNPDGSVPIHYEVPIGPPTLPGGGYDYQAQSLSLEHPTVGAVRDANGEGAFVTKPEFCGSCHDLTVPVLNHGMPEQRTYTEWKNSDFGRDENSATYTRCQDCHMPTQMHEYADDAPVSLNPDPTVSGWFPYAKDRNSQGGTAFHKFAGANRDLPDAMKLLYPEPDLEVLGAPTGNDPRIFPGMLSTRDPMYDRAQRNTEISLQDAVDVQIIGGPTLNTTTGKWEVQVKVTNNTGHRIPSGYPDGRRLFVTLQVKDQNGVLVYESGHYDQASATLFTDSTLSGFQRALEPVIDSASNAVMVYERVTGTCVDSTGAAIFTDPTAGVPVACTASPALTNNFILFDNRILPAGFDYAALREAGVKFWNYGAGLVPVEDADRFPNGQNWDVVTYTFTAPVGSTPTVARAELNWQTHTREFVEHLKDQDVSTVRPEGPPSIYDPNYPLTPNYLSDVVGLDTLTDLEGNPLNDNWGGIAYASWLLTGKGAPFVAAAAETGLAAPAAPAELGEVWVYNPDTDLREPYTQKIAWSPVPGAEGYLVWIKYGVSDATAAWDRLAVVPATQTEMVVLGDPNAVPAPQPVLKVVITNTALNVAKTYQYRVQAFNAGGYSVFSPALAAQTPNDLPLPPENLQFVSSTSTSISMAWYDAADNEDGFILQRQDVPVVGDFYQVGDSASQTPGFAFGGNTWTDTTAQPARCYNYRVAAYNGSGLSTWNVNGPVQMCTGSAPGAPSNLTATALSGIRVDLTWTAATGTFTGYRLERATNAGFTTGLTAFSITNPAALTYSDLTVQPNTAYWYRLYALNAPLESPASNTAAVITPPLPPAAPSNLVATVNGPRQVTLTWKDNANNEQGFVVERATGSGAGLTYAVIATLNTPNTTTYVDTTVQPKFTYSYRVKAFNLGGPSAYSNVAVAITPGEIPQPPSNLRVTSATRVAINLAWNDNATNEQGFYVERRVGTGAWVRIATLGANVTTYRNTGLTPNMLYSYRVQAYNADGVSAYSNIVTQRTRP